MPLTKVLELGAVWCRGWGKCREQISLYCSGNIKFYRKLLLDLNFLQHITVIKRDGEIYSKQGLPYFFFFLGGPLLYLNGKPCAKRKHLLYHIVLLRCNMVLRSQFSSLEWLPAQSVTLPTMLRSWKKRTRVTMFKENVCFFFARNFWPIYLRR